MVFVWPGKREKQKEETRYLHRHKIVSMLESGLQPVRSLLPMRATG